MKKTNKKIKKSKPKEKMKEVYCEVTEIEAFACNCCGNSFELIENARECCDPDESIMFKCDGCGALYEEDDQDLAETCCLKCSKCNKPQTKCRCKT